MNRLKLKAAAGLILALGAVWLPQAQAAAPTNPVNLDLLVTFSATLSVKIDGIQYSTRTLGPLSAGQTAVPPSSATVTNDAAGLTEKFQLSTLDASPASVSPLWSVGLTTGNTPGGTFCATTVGGAGCPGPDTYALQALFISSAASAACPVASATDWDTFKSTVAATVQTYVSNYFSDTTFSLNGGSGQPDQTSGAQDGNMFAVSANPSSGIGKRGLCVRLTMPSASSTVSQHTVRLTITAIVGS